MLFTLRDLCTDKKWIIFFSETEKKVISNMFFRYSSKKKNIVFI